MEWLSFKLVLTSNEVMNLDVADFSQSNINAAKSFWSKLNLEDRPSHVDYFFFGGANHKTFSSNEIRGRSLETPELRNSGDGTVPITSSIVWDIPHGFSAKNHGKIFTDRNLRLELFKMLDAPDHVKPYSAHGGEVDLTNQGNRIGLSLDKENYEIGQEIELSISYTQPKESPMESFTIAKVDIESIDNDQIIYEDDEYRSFNVQFNGVNVRDGIFTLDLQLEEGYYELIPRSQTDDPTPTFFTVKGSS